MTPSDTLANMLFGACDWTTKVNIILVEDDPAVRHSLEMLLVMNGHEVRAHESGTNALQAPPIDQSACLIIDYILPDTDGLTLLGMLRSKGWTGAAFLITGHYDHALEERALEAGFKKRFEKPFHYLEIVHEVEKLMSQQAQVKRI